MTSLRTLREAWYPLLFDDEVKGSRPCSAELWGQPLVLFRDARGRVVCLEDACPHRCFPLSAGQVRGGELQCNYHGWRFDGEGRCVHIPSLTERRSLPQAARVETRPTLVRQRVVWVWAGDPSAADPSLLEVPDFPPGYHHMDQRDEFECHYALLTQNAVDIAHFFLHRRSVALPFPPMLGSFEWSEIQWSDEGLRGELTLADARVGLRLQVEARFPTTVRIEADVRGVIRVISQYHITPMSPSRSRGFSFIGMNVAGSSLVTRLALQVFQPLFSKGVSEDKTALRLQQERVEKGFTSRAAAASDRFLLTYEKWRRRLDDGRLWHAPGARAPE